MRRGGRIVSVAVIIAVGVNTDGRREVLGMTVGDSEAAPFWIEFLRSLRHRDTNAIVAVREADRAGFGIMKYGDEEAHLLLLAVKPSHRRCGVASEMLAWLERSAEVAGVGRITLEARASNGAARAFYCHHGYAQAQLLPGPRSSRHLQGHSAGGCRYRDARAEDRLPRRDRQRRRRLCSGRRHARDDLFHVPCAARASGDARLPCLAR